MRYNIQYGFQSRNDSSDPRCCMIKHTAFFFKKLSIRLILASSDVHVKIASTPQDFADAFHIRWEVYEEQNYIVKDDFPNKKFSDEYDTHAVHFLAYKKGKANAGARIIQDSKIGFPIEKYFNIQLPKYRHNIVEISRLAIKKEERGGQRGTMMKLLLSMYFWSKEHGISQWYMYMPPQLSRSIEKFGVSISEIPYGILTEQNLKARESLKGYFKHTNARPYTLSVADIANVINRLGLSK